MGRGRRGTLFVFSIFFFYDPNPSNHPSSEYNWLKQEIIKVRERIPHIGPLTKVIPLKLFLYIVPSSSDDVTRVMRGQPKRFLETT